MLERRMLVPGLVGLVVGIVVGLLIGNVLAGLVLGVFLGGTSILRRRIADRVLAKRQAEADAASEAERLR